MSVLRLMNDEWVHEWMEGERKGGMEGRGGWKDGRQSDASMGRWKATE